VSQPLAYEYRHVIAFEETNLVGNVYYVNHLSWQGRCRELFLRDNAPQVLDELRADLCLVTLHCSCQYLDELVAFDEIVVRMRVKALVQNRLTLAFEYYRLRDGREQLVARGEQEVASVRRSPTGLVHVPLPDTLRVALERYAS
jgi:enediyne core biosynthesis thioesterase